MHSSFIQFSSFLAVSFAVAAALTAVPGPSRADTAVGERHVPFLTLRNRAGPEASGMVFGDERSDLKAGTCIVRETDLDFFSPLAEAAPLYIQEEFQRLAEVRLANPDDFMRDFHEALDGRAPVVYVHGFNISFEKGCRRASLLHENTQTEDRFLWFSWPSDGVVTSYPRDESDLYWSVPDLADVILDLEKRFQGDYVDIVGHSLGARGVVLALQEVAYRRPNARLGEIVLLAPDMDFEIFERMLPRIASIAKSFTVYVTSEDRPLALSAQLHGYPRLGQAGNEVWRLNDVEVIDLSDIPTGSPTGHLYHIYSEAVGEDLRQILNEGRRAPERRKLVKAGKNLWKFPSEE